MEHKDKVEAAKRLIKDKGIMDLLNEYMLGVEEKLTPQAIATMPDDVIGQITRADITADQKIRQRFSKITTLASQLPTTSSKKVKA